MRIPTNRKPTHPGEMLLEEYLVPMNITQRELALAIRVPYQRINELVNKKRGITPSTALRLAKYFSTSVEYWMNLQLRCDIDNAQKKERQDIAAIVSVNHDNSNHCLA